MRSYAPRHRPGFAGRRAASPAARPDAEKTWRVLIDAAKALETTEGPGGAAALAAARAACCGVSFPLTEDEVATSATTALLEMARTYARCTDERRGWRKASLTAVACDCEAMLDQARNAFLATFRSAAEGD